MKDPNETPVTLDPSGCPPEIPRARIFHEGLEPFAFDGIELWTTQTPGGFEIRLHYVLGPTFKAVLRDRLWEQDRCLVNGGILHFKDTLPWESVEALVAASTVRPYEILRQPALTRARIVQTLLLERLDRLTIRVAADDATALAFDLQLNDGQVMRQRVKRDDWSDIFALPSDLANPTPAP